MKLPDIKEVRDRIEHNPFIQRVLHWSRVTSLPGFFSVPIYDVAIFLRNEFRRDNLFIRANSMAFSFFLSLFPSIIVLFTLLPYFSQYLLSHLPGGDNFMSIMQREIKLIMPGNAGDMLFSTIEDITTRPRAGLLSLGFVLAVIFASNGMVTMMKSFEKAYLDTFRKRNGFQIRQVAIGLTILLGILLIASVVLIIVGNLLIGLLDQYIHLDWFSSVAISLMRYLVILSLFYSVISFIYRYGVATHRKFSFFSAGTTLATILSILSSTLFSFYVDNFNTYNKLYGSIGTVIVVMLWIQINALILLIGFELNASIAVNRDLKLALQEEEEVEEEE